MAHVVGVSKHPVFRNEHSSTCRLERGRMIRVICSLFSEDESDVCFSVLTSITVFSFSNVNKVSKAASLASYDLPYGTNFPHGTEETSHTIVQVAHRSAFTAHSPISPPVPIPNDAYI